MGRLKTYLMKSAMRAWEWANDRALGIRTEARADSGLAVKKVSESSKHKDSVVYHGADYRNIRRIVRILDPGRDDVVYDIGSGMGRVLCLFAQRPVRRVVGIELDPALCDIARANAARLRGRRSPVEIRCEDAALAAIGDGTIYFMYNPFGAETMREVLDKIEASLARTPRKVRIVYYTTLLEEEYLRRPWLRRFAELRTLTRRRITFWQNVEGG
jgi:predicted RNA methylase